MAVKHGTLNPISSVSFQDANYQNLDGTPGERLYCTSPVLSVCDIERCSWSEPRRGFSFIHLCNGKDLVPRSSPRSPSFMESSQGHPVLTQNYLDLFYWMKKIAVASLLMWNSQWLTKNVFVAAGIWESNLLYWAPFLLEVQYFYLWT